MRTWKRAGTIFSVLIIAGFLLVGCQGQVAPSEAATEAPATEAATTEVPVVEAPLQVEALAEDMNIIWGQQLGTPVEDLTTSISADSQGNSVIAGYTKGDMASPIKGARDILVAKFDTEGKTLWTLQNGTDQDDAANFVTMDIKGDIYIVGTTGGDLSDDGSIGSVFVQKISSDGKILWTKQYGGESRATGNVIRVDQGGNLFIAGSTNGTLGETSFGSSDAYILKLDEAGKVLWTCQWGTEDSDEAKHLDFDQQGNIAAMGNTSGDFGEGNFGASDFFYSLISANGKVLLSKQYGTEAEETAYKILVDGEQNVYLTGSTSGNYVGKQIGSGDSMFLKVTPEGELLWSKQFGTKRWDGVHGIVLSKADPTQIIISGCQNWDKCQAFLRKYDKDGNAIWTHELSPSFSTCGRELAIDDAGNIYFTGGTHGALYGTAAFKGPESDIFLIKTTENK